MTRPLLLLLAVLIPALGLRAQPPTTPDPPTETQATYTIAGTVVSSASGAPIQNATVEILTTTDSKSLQTTTADESGRFTFNAVPKGSFTLRGEAPGFLQSSYEQHNAFSTAIVTGSTAPTNTLTLRLHQLGSISGTVTDENAEPIRQATVHVFRRETASGDGRMVPAGTFNTDDLGRYRAPRLARGSYFVAVTARPWYATHANVLNTQTGQIGIVPYQDPTLDMAYPVTYFPAGSDPARASAIEINGNQAHADLQLTPTPAITLTFPREPGGQFSPPPQIQASIFGHATFLPFQNQQAPEGVTISSIAPGDYILRSNVRAPGEGPGMRFEPGAVTPVHISRDSPGTPQLKPSTLAHVRVSVRSADGNPLPPNLQVSLVPSDPADTLVNRTSGPAHQATLSAEPGDYYFSVSGARNVQVHDVSVGNKLLPSNDLHLAAGDTLTATLTLALGTHTLHGVVQRGGAPFSGAMLLMIPADQHLTLRTWFLQQSDLDGSFSLQALPPGPYLLLALDEPAWNADWRSPAFLSRHLPHATPILIKDTSPASQILPDPLPVEPL